MVHAKGIGKAQWSMPRGLVRHSGPCQGDWLLISLFALGPMTLHVLWEKPLTAGSIANAGCLISPFLGPVCVCVCVCVCVWLLKMQSWQAYIQFLYLVAVQSIG